MTKLKSKFKICLPYVLGLLAAAVLVSGAWFAKELSGIYHSRVRSEQLAESFVLKAQQLAKDDELEFEALVKTVSEGAQPALAKKAEKLEKKLLLTLVNPWNNVPEGYEVELEHITGEQYVDIRCAEDLRHMVLDCFMAGANPYICSSYRTQETQEYLYNNKLMRVLAEGYSYEDAPAVAAQSVAIPGTSEHQLGLAVDIIDEFYPNLNYMQEYTYTQQWLINNSWKYGFILRYPNNTTDITGIIYEPWHYRYVGKDVAAEINELGITFEEYLETHRGY